MSREIKDIKYCREGEGRCSWGYDCHDLKYCEEVFICELEIKRECPNAGEKIRDLEKYLQDIKEPK